MPDPLLLWPGKSANSDGIEHPAVYHMLDVAAVGDHVCILVAAVEFRARGVALGAGDAAQAEVLLRDGDRLGAEGLHLLGVIGEHGAGGGVGCSDAQGRLGGEIGAGCGEGVALERAEAVAAAFARTENRGKGVIALDGRMVERLHLEQARKVLARAGKGKP